MYGTLAVPAEHSESDELCIIPASGRGCCAKVRESATASLPIGHAATLTVWTVCCGPDRDYLVAPYFSAVLGWELFLIRTVSMWNPNTHRLRSFLFSISEMLSAGICMQGASYRCCSEFRRHQDEALSAVAA